MDNTIFTDSFTNMFDNFFTKIQKGQCKFSLNGDIAIKTSSGYKTYNLKKNRLTNCSNFVFGGMDELFFAFPTTNVKRGDIILVHGKPRCVIKAEDNQITVVNYEDNTVETILPERHVLMGNTYFYNKIVSLLGGTNFKGNNMLKNLMKMKMASEALNAFGVSNNVNNNNGFGAMFGGNPLSFMFMGNFMKEFMNGFAGEDTTLFDGLFDFGDINVTLPMLDTDDNDDNNDDTEDNE